MYCEFDETSSPPNSLEPGSTTKELMDRFREELENPTKSLEDNVGRVFAPQSGSVLVIVKPDTPIKRGEPVATLRCGNESVLVVAPCDGFVQFVAFTTGDRVEIGSLMAKVLSPAGSHPFNLDESSGC